MTLDEIRKLVAEERRFCLRHEDTRALDQTTFHHRARNTLPAFCDAVDALLAVVDALPTCHAEPERGTPMADKHAPAAATKRREDGGLYCDTHARGRTVDLPYAEALRALARAP